MKIREIVETDRTDWVRLREGLWPGSLWVMTRRRRSTSSESGLQRRGIGRRGSLPLVQTPVSCLKRGRNIGLRQCPDRRFRCYSRWS